MSTRNGLWMMVAALAWIVAACNYTVGECYPRGENDADAVGVGPSSGPSGSGGYGDTPPPEGGTGANACNKTEEKEQPTPPDDGTELGTYVRCLGLDWITCEGLCLNIGAPCSALALNPKRPELGIGKLKQCQRSAPGTTCTYCFQDGGLSCTQIKFFGRSIDWWCNLPGGKGCE